MKVIDGSCAEQIVLENFHVIINLANKLEYIYLAKLT